MQREYQGLQREYEALKAARLNEDVEELLREHNRHVTEHGAKAAELAAHWRQEVRLVCGWFGKALGNFTVRSQDLFLAAASIMQARPA